MENREFQGFENDLKRGIEVEKNVVSSGNIEDFLLS